MHDCLFLIGLRGCGKTTVGSVLAKQLGYALADTDTLVTEQAGTDIATIVHHEGWAGFRARETAALHKATAPQTVVCTGGGIILAPENRQFMREQGTVLYLDVPLAMLQERLAKHPESAQRPSLTGKSITEEMASIKAERDPLYRATAHHTIRAGARVGSVVNLILNALQQRAPL